MLQSSSLLPLPRQALLHTCMCGLFCNVVCVCGHLFRYVRVRVCVCLQPRSYVYDHVLSDPTLFPKFGLPTICENRVRHLLFV